MTTAVEVKEITLSTLANGAIEELFRAAVEEVVANIKDPNTDWKAPRVITLQVKFSADEERTVGDVDIKSVTKLAGVKSVHARIYYGVHGGRAVAIAAPAQASLFPPPAKPVALVKEETS